MALILSWTVQAEMHKGHVEVQHAQLPAYYLGKIVCWPHHIRWAEDARILR